jgi:hypothetical protein
MPMRRRSVGAFIAAFVVEPQLAAARKGASRAPIIQANSVDLPLPDGPISVSTSPGETENAISAAGDGDATSGSDCLR